MRPNLINTYLILINKAKGVWLSGISVWDPGLSTLNVWLVYNINNLPDSRLYFFNIFQSPYIPFL